MSRERIQQRLSGFKAKFDEETRRKRLQDKAHDGAGGMFSSLRNVAETDVNMSNAAFIGTAASPCSFSKTQSGFIIERQHGYVTRRLELTWEGGESVFFPFALTEIQDSALPPKPLKDGQLALKPNYKDGEIEYVYNEQRLKTAGEAADVILDWILPGPGDFDS